MLAKYMVVVEVKYCAYKIMKILYYLYNFCLEYLENFAF